MKNKTINIELSEEFKEKIRNAVGKHEEEKDMENVIVMKKKRNYKKIGLAVLAGAASVAGIGIAAYLKHKAGCDDEIVEIPDKVCRVIGLDNGDLINIWSVNDKVTSIIFEHQSINSLIESLNLIKDGADNIGVDPDQVFEFAGIENIIDPVEVINF